MANERAYHKKNNISKINHLFILELIFTRYVDIIEYYLLNIEWKSALIWLKDSEKSYFASPDKL